VNVIITASGQDGAERYSAGGARKKDASTLKIISIIEDIEESRGGWKRLQTEAKREVQKKKTLKKDY